MSHQSEAPHTNAMTRKPLRRATHLRSLEQRFMFDGAAVADAAHVAQASALADTADHGHSNTDADATHAASTPAPTLPTGPAAVEVRAADPFLAQGRKEAVFIDTSLADHQTLAASVRAGVAIVEFDGSRDGLAQIAQWAEAQSGFDALHLLTHGRQGMVHLGSSSLDQEALASSTHRDALATIGRALGSDGDLLLYGCDIGAGESGQALITELARLTGADIAASTDDTGAARLGGNWELEASTGRIDAGTPLDKAAISAYQHLLATVTFVDGSQEDTDAGNNLTFTRNNVDGANFTFAAGSPAESGIFMDIQLDGGSGLTGLYALSSRNFTSGTDLTVTVQNGYTFDLTGFKGAGFLTQVDVYYNGMTTFHTLNFTGSSVTTTFSGLTQFNDVTSITFTSDDYAIFQDLVISDVKLIPTGPTVTDPFISISGGSGTNGAYKIGDTVTATWNNTAGGNNNAGVTGVTVDFSAFGGGSAVAATESSGTWTATYAITAGALDASPRNVSISATTAAGTTTRADTTNATLDNVAPVVTDGRIGISGASGTGGAFKIGDTVTATWNNTSGSGDNNGDIATVKVDFSQFGGGSAVSATNSGDTWTATYTITSGAIDATSRNIAVTATDDAGNATTTADTTNATADNVAPTVTDGRISISGASGTGGAFKIGDTVTATWNNTTGGDNNSDTISGVTVDFSAFGGGSAVAASNSSETWTATYTITSGAIDGTSRNVSVTARDDAGNATTTADTTNATVDNIAPTVTDGRISISGASGTGSAFKIGDTVTATWNNTAGGDNNSDTISSVTVDFSQFGGGSAVAATNSGGTWTATYTISVGAIDATSRNISVTARDNAGNATTTADTTNATVDNVAPTVSGARIGLSGASGVLGTYKIGDTVTVTWNNTAGGDNNSDTISSVTVDFSQFGGGSAVAATNSGGTWTATYTLTAGAIDNATNRKVAVTATDNAGNTTTTASLFNERVDNAAPAATIATATLSSDTGNSGSDFITNTAVQTLSGTLSANMVSNEYMEFSVDNGANWGTATTTVGTNTWTANIALSGSNTLLMRLRDFSGNIGTLFSQAYVLDTTAPATLAAPDMTSGSDSGSSSADDITSSTTPTFIGTAESGSSVTLYDTDGTTVLGTGTATGGNWSITASTLSAGTHTIMAKATDTAGNVSNVSPGLAITVDTAAPVSVALDNTSIVASNASASAAIATLSATDASAVTYSLATGNGSNDAQNNRFTVSGTSLQVGGTPLTAGSYNIYIAATDAAGNVANQAFTLTVVDAPGALSVVRTGAASATVSSSATSLSYTITFDQAVTGVDTTDFTLTSTGTASGNIASVTGSGTTYAVVVDTLTGDGTLRLDLKSSSTGIQNGGSVPIFGGYTSGQTYTLDHTQPGAPSTPDMSTGSDTGLSSTDNITSSTTPTFTGTAESGSTVTLYDTDGTTVLGSTTATGGSWSITASALPEGSHTLTAKATDAAGNVSAASSGLAVLIDTSAPTVSSVAVPSSGSHKAGDILSFTLNTNEAVTVNTGGGTPRLALDIGGQTVYAGYASGSGTTSLVFQYTVQAGDTDGDGIGITALQSNGGTLRDAAGNAMTPSLSSIGTTSGVLIDTTAPSVNSVSVPANGTYHDGANLDFTVHFDEAITVDATGGTPRIALTIGSTTVQAGYLSGSGTNALVFRHAVLSGQFDADGITIGALSSNNGSLRDAAGNDATLTLNSVGSTAAVLVDATQPVVTSVTSSATNGIYKAGGSIAISVTFSKAVNVDTTGGPPTLMLNDGGTAIYSSGSGSSTLVFTHVVSEGQNSADLDYSSTGALLLNGATITDTTGSSQNATLTLATPGAANSLGANKAIVVDTTPPSITLGAPSLSTDTGSSATDFVTRTAAQTIGATLSTALSGGDVLRASLDNGATWTDVTGFVNGTTLSWSGVTLTGSSTLLLKVSDSAGNDGATLSQAYVLDTTAPSIAFASLAFSADTGSSASDFLTRTAAQTLTATLGSTLATGDIMQGSLDNGATWVDITGKVSGTALTWDGIVLSGSSTLLLKVTDSAGNDGAVTSQAYVLDTAAPTITFGGIDISDDTGSSDSDFVTRIATQTITATLSAAPAGTDKVMGSLDNCATWIDITNRVTGTTLNWGDATLAGSSTIALKVVDAAGNEGAVASQAYVLDTTAPTLPTFVGLTTLSTTPTLTGGATLASGETMMLTIEGGATYSVTPSNGQWNLDLATATPLSGTLALTPGRTFVVTVAVTDAAGNVATSTGALNVAVVPPPPPAPPVAIEPPAPPPPPPVEVVAPPPPPSPTFLSAPTQAVVAPVVDRPTPPPQAQPTPVPAPAPSEGRGTATPDANATLTRSGEGRFPVIVINSASGGGEGLVLNRGMSDQSSIPGARIAFSVPSDAFASTNPNAVVRLSAQQADGRPLPAWMNFNPQTGQFTGTPPPGLKGEVAIKIVARDAEGREVSNVFKVKIGTAGRSGQGASDDGGRPGLSEQIRRAAESRHGSDSQRATAAATSARAKATPIT